MDSLESPIVEGMVFDLNREPLLAGVEARPFGTAQLFKYAVELKAEIKVQSGGAACSWITKESGTAAFLARRRLARRFRAFFRKIASLRSGTLRAPWAPAILPPPRSSAPG